MTANSVVLPAHDGLIGILRDRAPLLCQMGVGVLRVEPTSGGTKEVFVDGGFAQVLDNEITILTDRAMPAEEISRAAAEKALAEAEKMPTPDEAAAAEKQHAIERARTQIRIAKK